MFERVGVLRALLDRVREGLDRVLNLLALLVDQPEMEQVLGVFRLDLDRLLHRVDRFGEVLPPGHRAGEEEEPLGVAVVHEHGLPQLRLGLLELAALDQQRPQPRPVARILGVELDRLAQRGQRGVGVAHPAQERAVLVVHRRVGIDLRQRQLQLLARRRQIALRSQRLAHAGVRERVLRVLLQRAHVRIPRLLLVAERDGQVADRLFLHRAEPRLRHFQRGLELLRRFRLLQPPDVGPVQPAGFGECAQCQALVLAGLADVAT